MDILKTFILQFLNGLKVLVRKFLDHSFAERWIGKFGPTSYASRSPSFAVEEFFLCFYKTSGLFG